MTTLATLASSGRPETRQPVLDDLAVQYEDAFVRRWDDLINWEKRAASEAGFFAGLLRQRGCVSVLDAAAGTGFHSVTLAKAGFEVTSIDGSAAMLRKAAINAAERGVRLEAIQCNWCDLAAKAPGPYDAIVCLGSSFPHLFAEVDRIATLNQFFAALKPGGTLVIDHRNFDAIRAHRYKSSGRYYYCGTGVNVSIEHVDATICRFGYAFPDGARHALEVYPILKNELRDLLAGAGFESLETYGDFNPDPDTSRADFVIHVALKPLSFRA